MDFKKVLDDNKGIPLVVTIQGRATTWRLQNSDSSEVRQEKKIFVKVKN
jgi:hypothetical protein